MVRSCYHRRNVLGTGSLVLGIKEVVNDAPGDDTLPVLLKEHIPRRVDSEQAVDHSIWKTMLDITLEAKNTDLFFSSTGDECDDTSVHSCC